MPFLFSFDYKFYHNHGVNTEVESFEYINNESELKALLKEAARKRLLIRGERDEIGYKVSLESFTQTPLTAREFFEAKHGPTNLGQKVFNMMDEYGEYRVYHEKYFDN